MGQLWMQISGESGSVFNANQHTTLRNKAIRMFPKGGVAAKVHVDDTSWLVFRPYGVSHSLAMRGDDLEELFKKDITNDFSTYLDALEAISIGRLAAKTLPSTNQPLKWRHLLAWCSRDQRTRFDGFFHWRSGDSLGFLRRVQDPPMFVNLVLGLVDAGLNEQIRKMEGKQAELDRLKQQLPELERAPEFALAQAEKKLRARVHAADDELLEGDLLSDSVRSRLASVLETAETKEQKWETESEQAEEKWLAAQTVLNHLKKVTQRAEYERDMAQALVNANKADYDRLTKLHEKLDGLEGRCELGNIEFSDCEHVQRNKVTNIIRMKDGREVKASANDLATQLQRKERELTSAKQTAQEQTKRANDLRAELRRLQNLVASSVIERKHLQQSWDELLLMRSRRAQGTDTVELEQVRKKLGEVESELNGLKTAVIVRQSQESARSQAIQTLTERIAARMLGEDGHARFAPLSDKRPFEVFKGGEAYSVLEVLLGDIACLLDAATSEGSHHPGFLVHDCPREADMSAILYRDFFRTVAEAAQQLGKDGQAPFQFIVTTTSPPPQELQGRSAVVLELEPGVVDAQLFRRELMPALSGFEST